MQRPTSTGLTAGALLLALCASAPAHAWKPTTHVYLAERALEDALDGQIELRQMRHHQTPTGHEPVLGNFAADPVIVQALHAHPNAFRAGVLGPDAYPDILAGQRVIHPDDHGGGSDAWLRYIYGEARASGNLEIIAFAVGFLAHAAGDMYGHTMVNRYAGGPFEFANHNAERHLVVEGYIGKKTPPPLSWNASLSPAVHTFIYEKMVDVTQGTYARELYDRKPEGAQTVPHLYSTLRDSLAEFLQDYRARRRYLRDQARGAPLLERPFWAAALAGHTALVGPLALYSEAWIDDIDRGLRAWPATSSAVAVEMMFSPRESCQGGGGAKTILDDFWSTHGKSMSGVPDILVVVSNFVSDVLDLLPVNPLQALQDAILEYVVEEATGKTPDEWCQLVSDPETFIDAMTVLEPSGRAGLDAALSMDSSGRFRWRSFPAASNTVTMIKLAMLGQLGLRDLLTQLGHPTRVTDALLIQSDGNAMLGFLRTLDGDNQWAAHDDVMVLHGDCAAYQDLFVRQLGDPNHEGRFPDSHYEVHKASGAVERCAAVHSVTLAPRPGSAAGLYCGAQGMAEVTLTEPVGEHGGRVRLGGDDIATPPALVWMPAGQSRQTYPVDLEPVLMSGLADLTAERQNVQRAASLAVGPAAVRSLRLREDFWEQGWQQRYIVDQEALGAGSRLVAEVRTDCDHVDPSTPVVVQICPVGAGPCTELARHPARPVIDLDVTLPLPAADGWFDVSASYAGSGVTMRVFVVATRVARVTFTPPHILLTVTGPRPATATIELSSPAVDGGERVELTYFRGVAGPASVIVPQGQRVVQVPVTGPVSGVAACSGTVGIVAALSAVDRARPAPAVAQSPRSANPAHPRAQLGYLGMEYAGARSTTQCLDWRGLMELNMRLDAMLDMLKIRWDVMDKRPDYPQEIRAIDDRR